MWDRKDFRMKSYFYWRNLLFVKFERGHGHGAGIHADFFSLLIPFSRNFRWNLF